jgi:hypothetical protein
MLVLLLVNPGIVAHVICLAVSCVEFKLSLFCSVAMLGIKAGMGIADHMFN